MVKKLPANAEDRRRGFNPWLRKMPWRRKWQPTLVFLPGKSHGQKSLVDCSSWGCKESDTTECSHKTSQDGYIYIYICIYVYTYICIYVYIYIHISDEPLLMPTYILNILILFLFFSEYLKSFWSLQHRRKNTEITLKHSFLSFSPSGN